MRPTINPDAHVRAKVGRCYLTHFSNAEPLGCNKLGIDGIRSVVIIPGTNSKFTLEDVHNAKADFVTAECLPPLDAYLACYSDSLCLKGSVYTIDACKRFRARRYRLAVVIIILN